MKPRNTRPRRPFRKEEKYFVGRNIRAREVRCIDAEGNHSVLPIQKALDLAEEQELDLVQISSGSREEVPTCKILDYSKFKYEQSKKDKAAKKKQRENAVKIKEIKFRPSTGDNDLKTKAKHAQEFIDDGHRLKVTIIFRGREMAYKNVARETLDTFVGYLNGAICESDRSMSGRFMSVMISKKTESTESTESTA